MGCWTFDNELSGKFLFRPTVVFVWELKVTRKDGIVTNDF